MSKKVTMHCWVSGKVQGVFFRANTEKKATELGLTGWVRNLSDGRVEVMANGEEEVLEKLKKWLHQGPPLASVVTVEIELLPLIKMEKFEVK